MDKLRCRKVAQRYDIQMVGILGLLMQGKRKGLINEVSPLIEELQAQNLSLIFESDSIFIAASWRVSVWAWSLSSS